MRVLHLTRDFPPRTSGGISVAVGGLCHALARAGMSVDVLSFDDYRPSRTNQASERAQWDEASPGLRVARVGRDTNLDSARQLARDAAPAVVHVHQDLLWPFARDIDARRVLSVHVLQSRQNELRGVESTASSQAQSEALDQADLIHCPSLDVLNRLANDERRCVLLPLATDMAIDDNAPSVADREELLLYVGRFADINGFGDLLAALPALLRARPSLQIVCAGGMPHSPKVGRRWQKRWQEAAAKEGVDSERVQWPGWLDHGELEKLYRQARLIAIPSWYETFGQVSIEAMTRGLPIVCTREGGLGDHLDEDSALIVPARDPERLGQAILDALEDPAGCEERAVKARERVQRLGDWDSRVPAFDASYRELLGLID